MMGRWSGWWRRARSLAGAAVAAVLVAACGGASEHSGTDATLSVANSSDTQTVLNAVPAERRRAQSAAASTTLRIHYRRDNGDTAGWQIHTWGAGQDPGWNQGWNPTSSDSFGAIYDIPLNAETGTVGFLHHKGDEKDNGGGDQSYTLAAGANEIWRLQGDSTNYARNPLEAQAPDVNTVRVHYVRFGNDHADWGLHLWDGSGLDTARLSGLNIGQWNAPVALSAMPNYALNGGEAQFDLPVLNPRADSTRRSAEFIIHGMPPKENDKDGRPDNIRIDFGSLAISGQVGHVWLVQGDAQVYYALPDLRKVSTTDARAVWLTKRLVQWPAVAQQGTVRLYWSATGQIQVAKDAPVTGADGFITLDPASSGSVPADAATRFKWVGAGAVYNVRDADVARLNRLHTHQLVLVQENADGQAQNATTAQVAGALDDLFGAATNVPDLGVTVRNGATTFKLWAPTARSVALFLYADGQGPATGAIDMALDPVTGVWSLTRPGDLSGQYYRFAVRNFVRGVGVVRHLVTDPYSLSLSLNSQRSYVANLDDAHLKPAGWDASTPPANVAASPDMSIYELHVRDFSASDTTVREGWRGKYMAFTAEHSNGMQHLRALAKAGLTDVHLLPVYDLASTPEKGCVTPTPSGAPDSASQQATVGASANDDCYNWGYDPWHFTAPDGNFSTKAGDGARRIVEFRAMVMALNAAGLRVGMDVVYNHTSASGLNDRSVLDRVVPGYYHRLNAVGGIEQSTCCENTATENAMMGKLMIDSVSTWARDYHISSFRFDIMGHQPRPVMEALKARVKVAAGRDVQLIGEGWNFGEVANGARFVQADMLSLNGSGIGTFNPFIRDAVRGGSGFDSGNSLVANQGFINGLWYDPNPLGQGRGKNELMWLGDQLKASLAGSIRSFVVTTHWDATLPLEQINVGGLPAGYVTDPSEVVNYVENHDNLTLFDNNVFKLPTNTSAEDRARVQILGAALNTLSQGIPYFHAGVDTLRSKSLDRNSYNSGDWFNRLDWTYGSNNFGVGLPPQGDNGSSWSVMGPLLANPAIQPGAEQISWTRDAFRDLLKIRASTTLLRLRTADDIKARLRFHNTGSQQEPTVLIGQVSGAGYAGANFSQLVYVVNVDKQPKQLAVDALRGQALQLHPVHRAVKAADQRAASATYDSSTGTFNVPARTAVVFVAR